MDLDAATKAKLKLIYPDVAVRVRRILSDVYRITGHQLRITQGIRTIADQEKLYAQGRTTPGPGASEKRPLGYTVTNAKPGDSLHHYGVAVDVCVRGPDPYLEKETKTAQNAFWKTFGRIAKAHGLEWGGDWRTFQDRPHIQLTYGMAAQEFREMYRNGGLRAVWATLDKIRGVPESRECDGQLARARMIEFGHRVS